jgi:hypothetical protein
MNKGQAIVFYTNALRDRALKNEKLVGLLEKWVKDDPVKEFLLNTFKSEEFTHWGRILGLAKEFLWKHRVEFTKALDTNDLEAIKDKPYLFDMLNCFGEEERKEMFKGARNLTDLITGVALNEGW